MDLINTQGIGNKHIRAYLCSALIATIVNQICKSGFRDVKNTLSICTSLVAITSFYVKLHKKCVSDKIFIYFSGEDLKSVVTLFTPEIAAIEAYPIFSNSIECDSHMMSIELNKPVLAPGNPKKAMRKIRLNHYHYHHEDNPHKTLIPQIILTICGKKISTTTEICFSELVPSKSFILDIRTKKYTKYTPIPDSNFVEQSLSMLIGKRSFLAILLDKYIAKDKSYINAEKAIYLLERFPYLIDKSALITLKQKIAKVLSTELKQSISNTVDTGRVNLLLKYLNKEISYPSTSLPTFTMEKNRHESLKSDIINLLKQKASNYHVLHEILKQGDNLKRLSIQNEEIVACYADNKTPSQTSSLLRKVILTNETLSAKLKAIHGYIDTHRLCSRINLEDTTPDNKLKESSPEDIYAHEALLQLMKNAPADTLHDNSIASIIEHARKKVSEKYCIKLLSNITGTVEKTCVRVEDLHIKIDKPKTTTYVVENNSFPRLRQRA